MWEISCIVFKLECEFQRNFIFYLCANVCINVCIYVCINVYVFIHLWVSLYMSVNRHVWRPEVNPLVSYIITTYIPFETGFFTGLIHCSGLLHRFSTVSTRWWNYQVTEGQHFKWVLEIKLLTLMQYIIYIPGKILSNSNLRKEEFILTNHLSDKVYHRL